MFKIEKDVPVAKISGGPGRPRDSKYPFDLMDVGDSFFVDTDKSSGHIVAQGNKRHPDRKFVSRTVEGGVRVWRVE